MADMNDMINDEHLGFPWESGQIIDSYRLNQMVLTDEEVLELFNEEKMITYSTDENDNIIMDSNDDTILNFNLSNNENKLINAPTSQYLNYDEKFIVTNGENIAQYEINEYGCGGAFHFDVMKYLGGLMTKNPLNMKLGLSIEEIEDFKETEESEKFKETKEPKLNDAMFLIRLDEEDENALFGAFINNKKPCFLVSLTGDETRAIVPLNYYYKIKDEGNTMLMICAGGKSIPVYCPEKFFNKIKGDMEEY